jgi:hypothetical protein
MFFFLSSVILGALDAFFWVPLGSSGFFWVPLGFSGFVWALLGALGAFVRAIVLLPPALHLGSGGAGCVCQGHSPASAFAVSVGQRREGAFVGAIVPLPPSRLSGSTGALGAFVRAIVLLPPTLHSGSGGAGCVCQGHSPASAFAVSVGQRREGAFVGAIASLPPLCLLYSFHLIYIIYLLILFTDYFFCARRVHHIGNDSFDMISLLTTFPHFLNLARFLGNSVILHKARAFHW